MKILNRKKRRFASLRCFPKSGVSSCFNKRGHRSPSSLDFASYLSLRATAKRVIVEQPLFGSSYAFLGRDHLCMPLSILLYTEIGVRELRQEEIGRIKWVLNLASTGQERPADH